MLTKPTHSRFSASASSRWLSCLGSVAAEAGLPDVTSVFAQEGNLAHSMAHEALLNRDIELTGEMGRYVTDYINYIDFISLNSLELLVETKVDYSHIASDGYGTLDAAVIYEKTIHIIDFKYGRGIPVSSNDNSQLKLYALALLKLYPQCKMFILHIVQPRISNYSSWQISSGELSEWGFWVKYQAKIADKANAPKVASKDNCRFCKAKSTCGTLHTYLNKSLTNIDHNISSNDQKEIIVKRELVYSFFTSLENDLIRKLTLGEKIEDLHLGRSRKNRKWIEGAEEILVTSLGENAYEKKLISPSKVGKTNKALTEKYSYRPEGDILLLVTKN